MHSIARLAVAVAASLSLTLAIAAEPAYAAHKNSAHPVTRPAPAPHLTAAQARAILIRAARHHRLNPNFVLAVSYWESGWNQAARSYTGAVGLMQVEPYTAAWPGPALLHRRVNLNNPVDNAAVGAGLLRSYLDQLHDRRLLGAGHYHGLPGAPRYGMHRRARSVVTRTLRLCNLV